MQLERQLFDDVREVVSLTLGLDETAILDDLDQQSCGKWTSLAHMTLLVALEERFAVTLSMDEMVAMTSLPAIVEIIRSRSVAQSK